MAIVFDNEIKDRIRMAVSIVDLVGSYLELRRQGRSFVARCPFHDDRHPSLQINPERQTWKCFVCDIGGDIFSFVMQKEGVEFPEALRMLADRAGIVLEQRPGRRNESGGDKRGLYQAMEWATAQFHQCFQEHADAEPARRYIEERGIHSESIARFRLGFAPDSWTWLVDQGITASMPADVLDAVGLLARSERGTRYDRFRGRVMFPINDPQGRPIAVGGRILPGSTSEAAKYINCSETRLYQKNQTLYGLDQARDRIGKTRQAVVMEGYTDVIMAFQNGIENAIACCGTALGENHIRILKRYCDTVVLVLDGDEAGQRRTSEILELFLTAQMDLRILTLPDALDPCDFLLRFGGPRLQELIDNAVDALEHKVQTVCRGFDPLLDTHRATTALEDILHSMARVSSSSLLSKESSRLRQDQILVRLSRQFGIEQSEIRLRLDSIRRTETQRMSYRSSNSKPSVANGSPESSENQEQVTIRYRYQDLQPIEAELFEILTLSPELASMAIERYPSEGLESQTAKNIFQLYVNLEMAAHALDFSSILSATEDPSLKSVLVSIEQHAANKAAKAILTAEERLHSLCERWGNQDDAAYRKTQIRTLEQETLDSHSELELLQMVFNQARIRQGIVPAEE